MKKIHLRIGGAIHRGYRCPHRPSRGRATTLLLILGFTMTLPAAAQSTWTSNYLLKTYNNSPEYINSQVYDNGTFVGVGTTTPSQRLDVNGNVRASGAFIAGAAAGAAGLILHEVNAGTDHSVNVNSTWELANEGSVLKFNKTAPGSPLTVMKLQSSLAGGVMMVNGLVKATRLSLTQGAAEGFVLSSSANGAATWKDPASFTGWTVSGDNVMKSSGKVGVGTTDMTGQCNIQTANDPGLVVKVTQSAGNWGYGVLARVESPNVAAFAVEYAGDPSLMIWGDGRIHATAVKVKVPVFPDYVFSRDYSLMPLEALQAFINNNGHLPGIPTAAEVATDGLNLGEITTRLVEKVEELSLYVIQLNEQNNELRARLEAAGIPNTTSK